MPERVADLLEQPHQQQSEPCSVDSFRTSTQDHPTECVPPTREPETIELCGAHGCTCEIFGSPDRNAREIGACMQRVGLSAPLTDKARSVMWSCNVGA